MYKSILSAMLGDKNLNGDGKKAGNGKNTYMNGDRYDGTWKNDVRDGYGTQYFASGDKYEGAWANNAMYGAGIYSFARGDRVEGEWRGEASWPQHLLPSQQCIFWCSNVFAWSTMVLASFFDN